MENIGVSPFPLSEFCPGSRGDALPGGIHRD
jgi:hypothetical protein